MLFVASRGLRGVYSTYAQDGKLPFSKVGSHRRLKAADVMAYKDERDAEQRDVLRELSEDAQKHKLGY